jgi:hypothetical protein
VTTSVRSSELATARAMAAHASPKSEGGVSALPVAQLRPASLRPCSSTPNERGVLGMRKR